MAKLSEKRKDAIYSAVFERILDARVKISKLTRGQENGAKLDVIIAQAQREAAERAVRVAETGKES